MSRFTNSRAYASLSPHRTTLVKTSGWWRPQIDDQMCLAPGIDALREALPQAPWAGQPLHLTVCDALARYFIVEPASGLQSLQELERYVASCFEDTFGLSAEDWSIQADLRVTEPMFATALPKATVRGVSEAVAAARGSLLSMAPYFVNAFNRQRRNLKAQTAWLLTLGDGQVTIALLDRGRWRGVRSQPIGEASPEREVGQLLQRSELQFGIEDPRVPIVVCGYPKQSALELRERTVRMPTPVRSGRTEGADDVYRLALSRCGA